jgi:ADP-ribose pyrophosphatase YjhB (NUDIX family)
VTEEPTLTDGVVTLRPRTSERGHAFAIEVGGGAVGALELVEVEARTGEMTWRLDGEHRGRGYAARAVRALVDWALTERDQGGLELGRVQAKVDPANGPAMRVATRSGLRREGVQRVPAEDGEYGELAIYARLDTDPPLTEPGAFRALLNSFLPRKRAIGQLLVRDEDDRVLLCQLTYKNDWDLPGGVVEVGESPRLATSREITEELGLDLPAGELVLTDWLPPWGGWDDAVCLVFDGGRHEASLLDGIRAQEREIRTAEFCTLEQVDERCADFTARRIRAALDPDGPAYTESGRPS